MLIYFGLQDANTEHIKHLTPSWCLFFIIILIEPLLQSVYFLINKLFL